MTTANPTSTYINALIDGGWSTVTVLNPTPTYVNALVDGGFVTAQITNPVYNVNVLVDGGYMTVNVLNPYTSFDGGWVSVMNFPASQPVTLTSTTITGTVATTLSGDTALTDTQLRISPITVFIPLQPNNSLFPVCNKIRKTGCRP